MKEQIISFETAKLLKEAGFNYSQPTLYNRNDKYIENPNTSALLKQDLNYCYPVPTQSLVQKWLREKYDIKVCISWTPNDLWLYEINYDLLSCGGFKTYEQALENALQEALKLIINNKN